MNRNEIITGLAKAPCNGTLLNFPDRGPWGESKYRGNCSGWIHAFLINQYKVKRLGEVFAGSGTGSDVCRDMGVPYIGLDLNPNPKRPDILVGDAIFGEVPEEFYGRDMIFMHPPYSALINVPYADSMWKDADGTRKDLDLGRMSWKEFIVALNKTIMKFYLALPKGGRMSILMGDIKRQGRLYSMLSDIVKPGTLEQVLIKGQFNCVSDGRSYSNSSFVPITHEYLLVVKKDGVYLVPYSVPKQYEKDVRDAKSATWTDIVFAAMQAIGGKSDLERLYAEVASHERARSYTSDLKAKIRQTLQRSRLFAPMERGVWALAAA